jgi:hypothetical protein
MYFTLLTIFINITICTTAKVRVRPSARLGGSFTTSQQVVTQTCTPTVTNVQILTGLPPGQFKKIFTVTQKIRSILISTTSSSTTTTSTVGQCPTTCLNTTNTTIINLPPGQFKKLTGLDFKTQAAIINSNGTFTAIPLSQVLGARASSVPPPWRGTGVTTGLTSIIR